jgi:hypothetical protein
MAQSLELNIKTTSDVPQAMDKAKTATVSFGKQVEDIQRKFSMAFKDVFLSFLGPIALLGVAINQINNLIEENRRKREEANKAAIDGTNELMSAEDRYWARKMQREKQTKESVEQAKTTREEVTREFLKTDPRGRQMLFDYAEEQRKKGSSKYGIGYASEDVSMQDKVQALISEAAKEDPMTKWEETQRKQKEAAERIRKEEDVVKAKQKELDAKPTSFKGPEGFSNVVGVGANPVIEAMTAQLEEQRKQTALLERIAGSGNQIPTDFTKPTAAPSRASMLR